MGKIGKVPPDSLRELVRHLNVSDKEVISLKAGNCQLELRIALSDFNFQATLSNIRPNLNDHGSDVFEATKILQDHEGIITKLNSLQNDFMSALDCSNENIFEWKQLLSAAFMDTKEKLEQKKIKLIRRIGNEYIEGQSDDNSPPPKIVKPFRDKSQKFGLPCTFEAQVHAYPEPTVTWMFNDEPLVIDRSNITIAKNGSTYSLDISNVGPQHLGKYTLMAKNTWGETTCSAFLDHVSNHPTPRSFLSPATTNYSSLSLTSDEKRESLSSLESPGSNRAVKNAPRFISKLVPKEAHEGDSVRFQVRVAGNPEPEVRWFREGVEILNSPDFKISKSDSLSDLHFLEIPEIFKEDAGRFTCIIQNPLGSDQCSTNLVVHASSDFTSLSGHGSDLSMEELKVVLTPRGSLGGSFSNLMHIQTSTPPAIGTEQCVAPYFRATSKDLEVGEGRGARFDAIVAGKPNPDVVWVKDGRRITTDRKYCVVVNEKGVNSLIIRSATLGDEGCYQCIASNKAGEDWFKVTLTVLPAWNGGRYSPTNSMTHVARSSPPRTGKIVSSLARTFHSEERAYHRTMHSRQFHSEERRSMRKNFYKEASPGTTERSVRPTARKSQRGPMFYNKNVTYTSNASGAPQLIEPIMEPDVKEGETAVMSCRITCPGPCNYEWFSNNQPLDLNPDKHEVEVEGDRYTLKIKSVAASDRGFYQCTVSNEDGEVTCIGRLNIPGTQFCRLAKSPLPTGRSLAPSPQSLRHIEEVKLSCTVLGDPKPKLTWYIDGRIIDQQNQDFKNFYDDSTGLAEMTIRDVAKYINSTIKCLAENSQGTAETECILTEVTLNDPLVTDANYTNVLVHQLTKERSFSTLKTGPRFSHRVQPCMAEEGETVALTAVVHGRPRPIVSWIKDDGKELVPSNKHSIIFDDRRNTCKLLIHKCTVEDSGEYSCIAYNPTGHTTCTATIHIYSPQESKAFTVPSIKTTDGKTPKFQTTLQPKTEITVGEPVKFQCKIIRESSTKVTWYFNGVEISSGHNMKEDDGNIVSSLVIPDPRAANTGEYTCKARNLNGESRTTTYLFVKEDSGIEGSSSPQPKFCMPILQTHSEVPPADKDSNSYNKPPTFSLPLVNRIATEGSEVFFVVRFEGEPLPSIQWFANGNPVTEKTSDCRILTDFNKKESILYIREVFVGDEGEYTCKAENISGVAYATSHLYIKVPTEYDLDHPNIYELKKCVDITGKPKFSVELTLVPDYVSSGRHSITEHLYVDNMKSTALPTREYELDDTKEVRKIEVERCQYDQSEQPFSETISIDRSDQSVKTLEFEIKHQKPLLSTETFPQNFQTDSRTSIVSEMETELSKMPMFSETVSIDSRDSIRKVIPIISPPEIISQEDSEIRRLTVESEYELMPEQLFSETVSVDTSKVQEVVFEALPSNQTSEITVHQDASLKGMKMEAEIILVKEIPQIFSEILITDKSDSKEVIFEMPGTNKTSEITIQQKSTLQGIKMEAEIILEDQTFSETVSIDKSDDRTHTLEFTLPKETKTSELTVHQESMPRGIKVEAEVIPEKNLKSELVVETGHAPKFLVELVPTTVMDGSPVEFTTKLVGRPMPRRVTWYRNDKNCDDIVHIITDYNELTGESHLQIAEVFPEDSGYYTCLATNVHGTAKSTALLTVAAYQYLESESESEVASSIDIETRPQEVTKQELVRQHVTAKSEINKKEYFIEPTVETTKFEHSQLEYKILETDRASKDFQSSTLLVQPDVKKIFALVSPQTQIFREEQLARLNNHFTPVQARSSDTQSVLSEKPVKNTHKTYVPVGRVQSELEEIIGTLTHLEKESGKLTIDTREICRPKKDKLVSWVTPKIEQFEEKIVLELLEQPIPENVAKEEIKPEFGNSTKRKEEVLVTLSHEFNSEGEEDELFVEARESLDKIEIIFSELNVRRPAKTQHFTNVTSQKIILDLEDVSSLSDKPERSCAKTGLVELALASAAKKPTALQNGASQRIDLKLENTQQLQTRTDTKSCESILISSNLELSNKELPRPSLIRPLDSVARQHQVEEFKTDLKSCQCNLELITSKFSKLLENLKPISHSCSVVEITKPEQVNLRQESKLGGMISLPENIVVKLMRIEALETILYRTSLLEYLMILEKELSLKAINLDNFSMVLPFPEIVSLQTGLATACGNPITRVLTNVYFIKLEEVVEKDMSYQQDHAHTSIMESVLKTADKYIQPLAHSFGQLNNTIAEQIVEDAISKVSGFVCRPENIVTRFNLSKKTEAVLYRVSLLSYVILLERILELKTLDVDSLSVMLPLAELTFLQTSKALLNEKPTNRSQTNIYLLKLEFAEKNEFKFEPLTLNFLSIPREIEKATEEKRILSHSSSILHHKALEEADLGAASEISRIHAHLENIKEVSNRVQKDDKVLSRVTPMQYVMILERILALNTLNIENSALSIQLPEIVLLQTGYASSVDKPLCRTQPNLYFLQLEQAILQRMDKSDVNIHPSQIPSNIVQNEQRKDSITFNINTIYDYILEEFLESLDHKDLQSLSYKMSGMTEGSLDLDKCIKTDKPLNKAQIILNFQDVERTLGYTDRSLENVLTRPSILTEPMARREKSFKNVFKTFAVATLAKFNHENVFELFLTPQSSIQIEKQIEEDKVRERVKVNETVVRQTKEIDEKEVIEKVPDTREHRPTKPDEKLETVCEERNVQIKPEKLMEEPSEKTYLHEEKQMIKRKKTENKKDVFEEWTVTTETERDLEKKEQKEDAYIFEEWEEEIKVPEKEDTSLFEECVATTKSNPEVEETSMFEEWETVIKTEKTIELRLKEEKEESDEEKTSLHEEWEVTKKTELNIEEEEKPKLVEKRPISDSGTETMFEEWEYDTKTTYFVEKDHQVKEPTDDDKPREDMYEEWETTLKTQYMLEKDVTQEIESDNESDISTQSLYEEWEFTTITKSVVEEEFPMKREVIEIRYPQKRGTNIILNSESTSKDLRYIDERKIYERITDTKQTFIRPTFDDEITCTKALKGLPLILSCRIKSYPEANVEWFKDGNKINQSPSFTIRYQSGYSTLTLNKLTNRYFGRYSCRATNEVGTNEISIVLDDDYFGYELEEINKDYDRITEEESFDEIRESWTKVTDDYILLSFRDTSPQEPAFELEITSVTVFDGFDATLACRVFGYPLPTIEWFFKGKKIEKSSDFVMTYKDGYCSLTISEAMQHDQGQYIIKATNEYGTAETNIYLTVLDSYELRSSSSMISKKVTGRSASEDDLYSSGEETMDMWTVEEWTFYDLSNQYAIEVFMKKEPNYLQLYRYVPYDEEAFKLRISSAAAALRDTHPYRFPVIIKELPIIEVFEKKKAVLECVVEAWPEPEITWFKNGKVLTTNDYVKMTFRNNVCTLTIDEVSLEDEAEYKCEARNEFGSSFTWGQIYVETVQLRWGRIKNFKIIRKKSL